MVRRSVPFFSDSVVGVSLMNFSFSTFSSSTLTEMVAETLLFILERTVIVASPGRPSLTIPLATFSTSGSEEVQTRSSSFSTGFTSRY